MNATTCRGSQWFGSAALVAIAGAACGCGAGGGAAPGPPLQPVEGIVKWKDQPLAGADVVFQSKEGSKSSFGRTDASGHYSLTTRASNDGAPEGDYLVAISKTETAAQDASKIIPQEDKRYNPFAGKGVSTAPPKSTLPPQYGDTNTSGLTARVNVGKNTLDFNLK